ncbi:DUF5316 domain-containing protein [Clostridium frigoris]|uniref:DUF5316 domain-containing protein n=1 Tax=Clostridium frigoris TaxID=205327 RepID=A0ABS6BV60_9CLOT|nr:DUF5316 family protein [Clostridium frigoris]MBU3160811.1 DUF5316 domain-containing protein [Clostridium frigoris]
MLLVFNYKNIKNIMLIKVYLKEWVKIKKIILSSFIIMCISIVLGKVLNNWILSIKICGSISLVCFGLAGTLNGSSISKRRFRLDTTIDKEDAKIARSKITNFAMIVGSTNTILAITIFFLIK